MLLYIAKRLVLVIPVVFAVALVCFLWCTSRRAIRWSRCCRPMPARRSPTRCARPMASTGRCRCSSASGCGRRRQRRSRHLDRHRALGRRGSLPRGRQHRDARGVRLADRLRVRHHVRLPRRLFPRHLGRQARHHALDHRRVDAALLARHGAGDHLLGAARLAARRRRRAGRLGLGLGAHPVHGPARRHHVGDPDGHRGAHGARAGRRPAQPGVRAPRCAPRASPRSACSCMWRRTPRRPRSP